jgi:AraC-like DNA-binding protein
MAVRCNTFNRRCGRTNDHSWSPNDSHPPGEHRCIPRAGCVIPGAPPGELTNRVIAVEDLGSEARQIAEGLSAIRGETERIACLESALVRRIMARSTSTVIDIPKLATWIIGSGGQVTVEGLAETAGLSRQHFARVFRASVGVGPKVYCQLARFRTTLAYARRGDAVEWAKVAAESGYADQSHMIAEFRRFSGMTPEALLHGRWFHPFIELPVRPIRRMSRMPIGNRGITALGLRP